MLLPSSSHVLYGEQFTATVVAPSRHLYRVYLPVNSVYSNHVLCSRPCVCREQNPSYRKPRRDTGTHCAAGLHVTLVTTISVVGWMVHDEEPRIVRGGCPDCQVNAQVWILIS